MPYDWIKFVGLNAKGKKSVTGISEWVASIKAGDWRAAHPAIWKSLIVTAAIGLTVFISATISMPKDTIGVIATALSLAVLGLILVVRFQRQSPIFILLVAAFVPFGVSTGTGSRVMASLILTGLFIVIWLLYLVGVKKKLALFPSAINKPLIAFVIVVIVAWLWSQVFRDVFVRSAPSFPFVQAAAAIVMVLLPVSLLMVGNQVRDVKTLRWMVALILLVGGIDVVRRFANIDAPVNANGITMMWVVAFALSLVLFHKGLSGLLRTGLIFLVGISVVWGFVLHIDWLAGWLPGFIAMAILVLVRSRKAFLVLALAALVIFLLNQAYFIQHINYKSSWDGDTRMAAWLVNWQVTGNHLLFGTGPAGYAAYYMTYFPYSAMATHNNYIDIIAETGLVGFTLYILLFLAIAWSGYRLCRKLSGRGDFLEAMAMAVFAGTIGCIVIMAFGDWLIPFAYTQTIEGFSYEVYSWLFMGSIIAMDRLAQ